MCRLSGLVFWWSCPCYLAKLLVHLLPFMAKGWGAQFLPANTSHLRRSQAEFVGRKGLLKTNRFVPVPERPGSVWRILLYCGDVRVICRCFSFAVELGSLRVVLAPYFSHALGCYLLEFLPGCRVLGGQCKLFLCSVRVSAVRKAGGEIVSRWQVPLGFSDECHNFG